MSEIQSISQSNYILHNIDAKKLYVQEPLFTANSGDAVYVGWRPDETVLWETPSPSDPPYVTGGQTSAISLSDSYTNYNTLRLVYRHSWASYPEKSIEATGYDDIPISNVTTSDYRQYIGGNFGSHDATNTSTYTLFQDLAVASLKTSEPNKMTIYGAGRIGITNGAWAFRMDRGIKPIKVVGINRKENA